VRSLLALSFAAAILAMAPEAWAAAPPLESAMPWWGWPLTLFVVCFFLGIVAVPAGVGGGVLFVPIVGGFFPFHLDFVRGAGLLVALASALSAGRRCCTPASPACDSRCRSRWWPRPVPSSVP